MNEMVAFNNLLNLKTVFDNLNIQFWLDEGTALGAWRGNQFIENEGDIDVGFFAEDAHKIPELMALLLDNGWLYFNLNEHPSGEGKQLSCIRQGISVDISVYYLRGDKRWRCMFDRPKGQPCRYFACVYPSNVYNQLTEVDFMDYGVTFLVPPKEFLRLQYGDWLVPDPNFKWQTDYKSMDLDWKFNATIG